MLRDLSARRAVGLLVCTIVVALAAGSATASAGQALCIGPAGSGVTVPDSDGTCKAKNATLKTLVEQSELDAEKAKVAALQDKLSKVSYDETGVNGKPTLQISGANLQIVSGSGSTNGTVNGLGNVFIGYDEQEPDDTQTGSHNLILGSRHTFTSYGGLIAGENNYVMSAFGSVAGFNNGATGLWMQHSRPACL